MSRSWSPFPTHPMGCWWCCILVLIIELLLKIFLFQWVSVSLGLVSMICTLEDVASSAGGLSCAFSASASFLFFLCICVIKCSLHCVFNLLEINLWKLLESETNNNFHIDHKIDCSMLLFRRYVTFLECRSWWK